MENIKNPNDITVSFSMVFFENRIKEILEEILQGYTNDRLMTRKELLVYLKISATSLYTYQKLGLPMKKIGRTNLYRKSEIDAYIEVKKKKGGNNGK